MTNDEKTIVYVALGSNLGDRGGYINKALAYIEAANGIEMAKLSSIVETEPLGGPEQGAYYNAITELRCELTPWELLDFLLETESRLNRIREKTNGPRTIDLDILLFGDEIIDQGEEQLVVPHPRMCERKFILELMAEIAPDAVHPVSKLSMIELLDKLNDGD